MKRKVTLEQAEESLGLGALAARKEGGVIAEKEPEAQTAPAPRAKKKPEEVQLSIYVHKDLHRRVKIALAEDGRTLTGLLTEYLNDWLKNR
jgi:hypothetical protein